MTMFVMMMFSHLCIFQCFSCFYVCIEFFFASIASIDFILQMATKLFTGATLFFPHPNTKIAKKI